MISDQSDPNTLLVGSRGTISGEPDTDLKVALAKLHESVAPRLAFMTPPSVNDVIQKRIHLPSSIGSIKAAY